MASSPTLADLAGSFRRELRGARKADRTVTLYDQSIRFFCAWLEAEGLPATLEQFTRANVRAWKEHLADSGNVGNTIGTRLRGLRRFGRWLVVEGELERSPTDGIELPDRPDDGPPVLREDEIAKLLKACQVPRGKVGVYDRVIFEGRRDEAILRLLLDCGPRVSELANLELEDVDLDIERIWVVGKGNRRRDITFGDVATAPAVDRYLRVRRNHPYANRTNRLLLTQRGPISADGIRWRIEQLGLAAGIQHLHPHQFRHTRAHNWLDQGGSERGLKAQMGWRSDAMLSVYARSTQIERSHNEARRLARGEQRRV